LGDGGNRLVSYSDISGLECVLRRISPVHTHLVFLSGGSGAAPDPSLDFSRADNSQFLPLIRG
jgi:hypothetical protein